MLYRDQILNQKSVPSENKWNIYEIRIHVLLAYISHGNGFYP